MNETQRHVVKYRPAGETLRRFHCSAARVRFIFGPFGSAKTTACLMEIYRRARAQKPASDGVRRTRFAVVRATYPELETTTLKSWRALFDRPEGIFGRVRLGHPPIHVLSQVLPDQSRVECEVIFLAMDRDEDVEKLLSLELTGIYYNELSELPRAVVTVALGRVGRYPALRDGGPSWYGIIGDTNGMAEDHWFFDLAERHTPQGWEIFRQPGGVVRQTAPPERGAAPPEGGAWRLNPQAENLANLPPDYYADQMAAFSDDEINVYLAASYGLVKSGKPIWPDFHETLHVADFAPVPGLPISLGADWGLTPAAVFGQMLPDGSAVIFDEIVTENADAGELAELIKRKLAEEYGGFEVDFACGDPSGVARAQTDRSQSVFSIMTAAGLPFRPASTNDWEVRVAAIAAPLRAHVGGSAQLRIARRCAYLKLGMGGRYAYRRQPALNEARFAASPDKNIYSHVCEAAQYWALGAGFGRAVTRRGPRPTPVQAPFDFRVLE